MITGRATSVSAAPISARQADPPWAAPTNPTPSGATGIVIQLGQIIGEEKNDEVRGSKWYGDISRPGIADEMVRTDGHIRQSLAAMVNPTIHAIWDGIPADESAEAQEHARLWQFNLRRLNVYRFLRQSTQGMLKHGVSLFEPLTDVVEVPAEMFPLHPSAVVNGKKQILIVTELQQRLPRTISKWNVDPSNGSRLLSVTQYVQGDDANKKGGERVLPTVRADGSPGLLRFTYDEDGNNFEGLPLLRSTYFAWKMKRALRLLEGVRHERQNIGVPTITLPAGAGEDDKAWSKKILEALRGHERAYIVLPNGFGFQFNTSGQGNGTGVQQAIEMCDREIWMNVGAPHMLLGGSGDTGSYAMAETLDGIRILGLEGVSKIIQEPFNVGVDGPGLIPWVTRANYGPSVTEFPHFGPLNMPTKDWSKILPQAIQAVTANILTRDAHLEKHFRLVMGLPKLDPATARPSTKVVQTPAKTDDESKKEDAA